MNYKRNFGARKQKGMTLIEVMIAIGVALTVAAIAIGIGMVVRADQKTTEFQTQVMQVVGQAQSLGRGSYEGMDETVLIKSGKVPASWVRTQGAAEVISHALGGTIEVDPTDETGATGGTNAATLTVSKVTASTCSTFLTNTQANFAAISTTGGGVADVPANGKRLTAGEISDSCSPASGNEVTMKLTVI